MHGLLIVQREQNFIQSLGEGGEEICHFKGLGVVDGIILKCVLRKYGRVGLDYNGWEYK